MKKIFLIPSLLSIFILILGIYALNTLYVVPVMMYHNIAVARNDRERINSVSPNAFRHHMEFLKKGGYQVLSLDQYVAGVSSVKKFSHKTVVITFDDGLLNNYTQALPILEQNRLPAAFFIGVGDVGEADQMTWDQIKDASQRNITIGSHLMTEAYLPNISREQQIREIVDSKKVIEGVVGKPVEYLAYPIGGFSDEIKKIVRDSGYKAAFATNRGYARFNDDLFELKRVRFKDTDSDLVLWMKLSGYYNLMRKSKASH